MNIAPMSEPNTMMPETAATQNVARRAYFKSNRGSPAVAWRQKNATPLTIAMLSMMTPVST